MENIRHTILPDYNLIYIYVEGAHSMAKFAKYALAITEQDPQWVLGMNTLLDCRNARVPARSETDESDSKDLTNHVTDRTRFPAHRKFVTVVGDNQVTFGVTRMRSVPLDGSLLENNILKTIPEALAWLELPADTLEGLSFENATSLKFDD